MMSWKNRSRTTLAGFVIPALVCTSCNKPSAAMTSELKSLRSEVEDLREEKSKAPKAGEFEELKAENQALKSGVKQLEDIKAKADAAEHDLAELRSQNEELKKSNAELQHKVFSSIREKAIGETMAVIECPGGKVYHEVVIRSIDDYGVSFRYDGGSATVHLDNAPASWVKRFGLVDEKAPKAATDTARNTPSPTPAALPSPAPPADPATTTAPAPADQLNALSRKLMPAVVIIKGNTSEGSGFFAKVNGVTYLYTAAHVICGNNKLEVQTTDGRVFTKFGPMDIAENADMVRIAMAEEVPVAAELAISTDAVIGSPVFAMGDSGGGGVLTVLHGTVKGVGADELEMDAAVIQGNSGGPVFSAPSGRVIGVVTHLIAARTDVWAADTPFSDIRRFAARVDSNIRWRRMAIGTLINEARVLEDYNRTTRLLFALSALHPTASGLRTNATVKEGVAVINVLEENKTVPAVQDLLKMNTELGSTRIKLSEKDLLKKFASYYGTILSGAQRQTSTFKPASFASFNQPQAEASSKWRAAAEKEISTLIDSMR